MKIVIVLAAILACATAAPQPGLTDGLVGTVVGVVGGVVGAVFTLVAGLVAITGLVLVNGIATISTTVLTTVGVSIVSVGGVSLEVAVFAKGCAVVTGAVGILVATVATTLSAALAGATITLSFMASVAISTSVNGFSGLCLTNGGILIGAPVQLVAFFEAEVVVAIGTIKNNSVEGIHHCLCIVKSLVHYIITVLNTSNVALSKHFNGIKCDVSVAFDLSTYLTVSGTSISIDANAWILAQCHIQTACAKILDLCARVENVLPTLGVTVNCAKYFIQH